MLILKPSSLGDVVQALPVLRLLKRERPESEVYWWLNAGLAPLLEGDPDLAGLFLFSRRGWLTLSRWKELIRQVREMRELAFDWVIDLQGLARSGWIAWLANGRFTVGLDDAREGARGFYDQAITRPSYHTHAVDWYLEVLRVLGVQTTGVFDWLPRRSMPADTVRSMAGDADWVGLQPGARWLNKRWPIESYARLVQLLHKDRPQLKFVVLGGGDERNLGRVLATALPGGAVLDLTGATSLPEMVEWVRRVRVLVTNDTGPMHVAAAVKTPVVALFGPTEPRRTGPYGQLAHVIQRTELECVPCMSERCRYRVPFDCLRGIGAEQVVACILGHLGDARSGVTEAGKAGHLPGAGG